MSIDSRIVEMKFDNAEFERNAKTSMETLKKLDDNLKMEEGVKGLANVAKSVSNVSFAPMVEGLEQVSHRFSALEVAAITVVSRITDSVLNAAKNIVNALAIEPITSGMQEYEMKMDNVQTTMINSGKSLEEVNQTLDDLNHYADKTIFKFSDMTSALSKFTMAGITDLNLASTMIEGIGNIAGESGLKTEQASSAFYMISQAMSAGNMALYQWRTLETTGFASNKFRENLLETAVALGKIQKLQNGMYRAEGVDKDFDAGSMRNSLTKGKWFDKELMQTIFARYASEEASMALGFDDISESAFHAAQDIKTFSQMFDTLKEAAQSGWTESWQIIIGDYEQAKALWTKVNDVLSSILDKSSEQRNQILKDWSSYTGRTYLIDGMRIAWEKLQVVVNSITNSFKAVFGTINGKKLADISKKFYEFAESIDVAKKDTGLFVSTFGRIWQIIKTAFSNIKAIGGAVKDAFIEIFYPTKSLFDLFKENKDAIWVFLDNLKKKLAINDDTVDKLRRAFKGFFAVVDIGIEFFKALFNFLVPIVKKLFPKATDGVLGFSQSLGDALVNIRDWIKENNAFTKFFDAITNGFNKIRDVLSKLTGFIKTTFGPAWDTLVESIKGAFSKDDEKEGGFFNTLWNIVSKVASGLGNALTKLLPLLGKVFSFFGKIFETMIDGLGNFIDMASSNGIGSALAGITTGFATLLGLQLSWKTFDSIGDFIAAIKELGGSLKQGFIDFVDTFIGGFTELKDSAVFDLRVDALKRVATSILILAIAFTILAQCDPKSIAVSMGAITVAIGELLTVLLTFSQIGGNEALLKRNPLENIALIMIPLATSILIVAIAMKMLSGIDLKGMLIAILGMAVIFGGMALAVSSLIKSVAQFKNFLGNPKIIKSIGKMLEQLAISVLIMAAAVKLLSSMSLGEVAIGLGSILIFLFAVSKFVEAFPIEKAGMMGKVGAAILVMSLGILIIATAMRIIGTMDVDTVLVSMAAVLGLILAVAWAANTFQTINVAGILSVAGAITLMAAGILIIALAFKLLEGINLDSVLPSMIMIASIMALMVMASTVVNPLSILAIAAAMVVFATAVGVLAIALKLLKTIPVDKMLSSLVAVILVFTVFMALGAAAGLFPVILAGVAALTLVFMGFATAVGLLGAGIMLLSIGLASMAVSGVAGIGALVTAITTLLSLIPMAATMLGAGVIAFITAIAGSSVALIEAIVSIGLAVLEALIQLIPKFCEFVVVLVTNIIETIISLVPVFIDGLIRFWIAVFETVGPYLKKFFGEKVGPFLSNVWTKIKTTLLGWKDKIFEVATNIWQGFIDGIASMIDSVVSKAKEMAQRVVDTVTGIFDIQSPSRVMYGIGAFVDAGLANGIGDKAKTVVTAASELGNATLDGIKRVIENIDDIISSDEDFNPTITPVMDLSQVANGTRSLARMISNQNGGSIGATINGRLASISGNVSASTNSKSLPVVNQYELIQNNYSPKALSRYDIYRQTENQFSRLKGVISA